MGRLSEKNRLVEGTVIETSESEKISTMERDQEGRVSKEVIVKGASMSELLTWKRSTKQFDKGRDKHYAAQDLVLDF